MIYLVVLIFSLGTGDAQGWTNGQYQSKTFGHETRALCEQSRQQVIAYAGTRDGLMLISNCASDDETAEFKAFSKQDVKETS